MLALLLLSLVGCSYGIYPYSRNVLYDPTTYDVIYDSASGSYNESWVVIRKHTLLSIILPAQIKLEESSNYEEDISIKITARNQNVTALVATGQFKGTAWHGTDLAIPVYNVTDGVTPPMMEISSSTPYYTYTVEVSLNAPGFYPWRTTRRLEYLSVVKTDYSSLSSGMITGLEYSPYLWHYEKKI